MASQALSIWFERPSDMESSVSFFQMLGSFELNTPSDAMLWIEAEYYEASDWESLYQRMTEELLIRSKAFSAPHMEAFVRFGASEVLKSLSFGYHPLSELASEAVLKGHGPFVKGLKNAILSHAGDELLRTVLSFIDADLNQSKAAKDLYMHRNTLLYRIDQFTQTTGIDPRRFEGAFALKLLFR